MAYKSPITITGNITQDPELRDAGGSAKLTFNVAVAHRYMKNGEWVEKPSFFSVVAWRNTAEKAAPIIEKGLGVMVQGRLEQRSWETPEGDKRSMVEIVADDIAVNVWAIDGITRRKPAQGTPTPAAKPVASKPAEDPW